MGGGGGEIPGPLPLSMKPWEEVTCTRGREGGGGDLYKRGEGLYKIKRGDGGGGDLHKMGMGRK